ncbi:hypothetical protein AMECASPLE_032290 [Ameca splendens]|uniref:Uncharacterized protein n=1 Tax=Ameca splendens TaxID=208324 RepID=A0ABV1AEE0_9TELE
MQENTRSSRRDRTLHKEPTRSIANNPVNKQREVECGPMREEGRGSCSKLLICGTATELAPAGMLFPQVDDH